MLESVMYAIYGTWYRIHAHKVTQPYICFIHISIYTIHLLPFSRAALLIMLYSS